MEEQNQIGVLNDGGVLVVQGVTTDDGVTGGGVKNGVQNNYSHTKK